MTATHQLRPPVTVPEFLPFRSGRYHMTPLCKGRFSRIATGIKEGENHPSLAIKFLSKSAAKNNPELRNHFQREASVLHHLKIDNVPKFVEHGLVNDAPYFAYRYTDGHTLAEVFSKHADTGRNNPRFAITIAYQTLKILHAMHTIDDPVCHGDINPANLVLDPHGRIHLIDFGSAKIMSGNPKIATHHLGPARYLSPEQANGQHFDERSDIFQCGVVLYEMLTGRFWNMASSAFEATRKAAKITKRADNFIADQVGPELSRLIAQMLRPDPRLRVQSANEAMQWLLDIASEKVAGISKEEIAA